MLYKKDSKDKLRQLDIFADGDSLYQVSGLLDGKLVTSSKVCKAKNVGRANETSAEDQAIKEAAAKIKSKLSEGYSSSINEAISNIVILPMLAKGYAKEARKINWSRPVFVQPKLDGMRAISIDGTLISRKNKEIVTLNHLKAEIEALGKMGLHIPDGEVYAHGLSFQENMKLIKKERLTPTSSGRITKDVKYHLYDTILDEPFETRYVKLSKAISECDTPLYHIKLVPTYLITSKAQLDARHAQFLKEGYEGTIIRHGNDSYKINGRSSSLLKYKDFIDISVKVKNVIPDDANPTHGSCIFDWNGATGHRLGDDILGCGMKFSHSEREAILANKEKYIGVMAEVRFFEYSDTGVPRFPVCVGFRLDR